MWDLNKYLLFQTRLLVLYTNLENLFHFKLIYWINLKKKLSTNTGFSYKLEKCFLLQYLSLKWFCFLSANNSHLSGTLHFNYNLSFLTAKIFIRIKQMVDVIKECQPTCKVTLLQGYIVNENSLSFEIYISQWFLCP